MLFGAIVDHRYLQPAEHGVWSEQPTLPHVLHSFRCCPSESDLLLSENDVMSYELKIVVDLGIFFPLFLKKIQTFLFLVYF